MDTPAPGTWALKNGSQAYVLTVQDSNLKASNIRAGVQIFGVTGTFTKDATAKASQILQGKTAYVSGAKITGTYTSTVIPDVVLGYVSNGVFYELAFSGTSAVDNGSSSGLSMYTWSLPVSSGSSSPEPSPLQSAVVITSGGQVISAASSMSNVTLQSDWGMYVSSAGIVNGVTVSSGGSLLVSPGGSALAVTSLSGANVSVLQGGYIEYV